MNITTAPNRDENARACIATETIYRMAPGEIDSPLVFDVSRSGTTYPPEFMPPASFKSLHTKISPYVERVVLPCIAEGATVLMAQFPPTYVDPNRPEDDIDPDQIDGAWPSPVKPLPASIKSGSGLIHSLGVSYKPLYEEKLAVADVKRRIDDYYLPYHSKLGELLAEKRAKFGHAFQLSCHSMSSIGPQDGIKRPDICLGDLDGTTAMPAYVELVASVFRDRGFEVAFNKPFRGNELLRRHACPKTGIYSLQVEMRRDLYLNEHTRELHGGLKVLQDCFVEIARRVRMIT
ncbi:N-formylglutamate amidohydrolase [Mesorhizobium sp. B2-6-2]|uniref:N-formylglutamate amidohydrolase n=1 Tax=Mesorhizobium sp. B2-6-2 TaxID=2589915 RepID=UPI00112EE161|nr:N-formylglutamate amidohydrolase [Mesorhizobium sp. B2-6-2]TPJ77162.1 N-formylglutamate amidohydrolase [Mesorhizobium sp. B2-6-2]